MTRSHDALVQDQFGPGAADYISSAVHSHGTDLQRIVTLAAAHAPVRALDLGCGGGHVAYAIAPHAGQVTACDLSRDMIAAVEAEGARRGLVNLRTCIAPAATLPFPDGDFAMLACRFSAHHWQDVSSGLSEARRVLAPGGVAVFADVIAPPFAAADTHLQAVELLRDPSHVRDYTEAEWCAMLQHAGFMITKVTKARLHLNFADWIARMRTTPDRAAAIRTLQSFASSEVAGHFAIEPDGSFTVDTLLIEAK